MANKPWTTGLILKHLMFQRGLNVSALGRLVDIPQPTLHRIVEDISVRPRPHNVKILAQYFGLTEDQLKGLAPIPELSLSQAPLPAGWSEVSLLSWDDLVVWASAGTLHPAGFHRKTLSKSQLSESAFAVELMDASMMPIFVPGMELIFDPEVPPKDRGFVVYYSKSLNRVFFRSILLVGDKRFVHPLDPDLASAGLMELIEGEDRILGVLVEARRHLK